MDSKQYCELSYKKIIEQCSLYDIDEDYRGAVEHAIKLLVLELDNSKRVKIMENIIPVSMLEKDLRRLDFFIVCHVLEKFKEAANHREIRYHIAYLKTCIYNIISETKIHLDIRLRYEGVI